MASFCRPGFLTKVHPGALSIVQLSVAMRQRYLFLHNVFLKTRIARVTALPKAAPPLFLPCILRRKGQDPHQLEEEKHRTLSTVSCHQQAHYNIRWGRRCQRPQESGGPLNCVIAVLIAVVQRTKDCQGLSDE